MKKLAVMGIIMLFMFTLVGTAGATNVTARAYGMGGAFTGVADDMSSVIYNPAGLSRSGFLGLQANLGLTTPSLDEFEDLRDLIDYMGDADFDSDDPIDTADTVDDVFAKFPEKIQIDGQLFAGLNMVSLGAALNIQNNFVTARDETSAWVQNTATSEGIVSVGKEFLTLPGGGPLIVGTNFKYMRTDFAKYEVDTVNSQTSTIVADGSGMGLDVGVLAELSDTLQVGAMVKNLWAQEYTLSGDETVYTFDEVSGDWTEQPETVYERTETPGSVMRVGASLKIPSVNATIAADIDNFPVLTDNDQDMIVHLGMEKNLLWNGVTLRAGTYNQTDGPRVYTAGVGLNLWKFHIDAAAGFEDGFDQVNGGVISANMKF